MKTLVIVSLVMLAAGVVMAAVRPPAVAGAFYTADPSQLQREVAGYLARSPAGGQGQRRQ